MAAPGSELLAEVAGRLPLDPTPHAATGTEGRTLSWSLGRLVQTLSVDEVTDSDCPGTLRIIAETRVLEGVSADEETLRAALSAANQHAFGNAYGPPDDGTALVATASAWVMADTMAWRASLLADHCLGQLLAAERDADSLSASCGGRVAACTTTNGLWPVDASRLASAVRAQRDAEQLPCRFRGSGEFAEVAAALQAEASHVALAGDGNGLSLETPFADHTALMLLEAKGAASGAGLDMRVKLPLIVSLADALRLAMRLNGEEREQGPQCSHWGAWHVEPDESAAPTIVYGGHVPNGCHRRGLVFDAAIGGITRMRWIDAWCNERQRPESLWQRLRDRRVYRSGGR